MKEPSIGLRISNGSYISCAPCSSVGMTNGLKFSTSCRVARITLDGERPASGGPRVVVVARTGAEGQRGRDEEDRRERGRPRPRGVLHRVLSSSVADGASPSTSRIRTTPGCGRVTVTVPAPESGERSSIRSVCRWSASRRRRHVLGVGPVGVTGHGADVGVLLVDARQLHGVRRAGEAADRHADVAHEARVAVHQVGVDGAVPDEDVDRALVGSLVMARCPRLHEHVGAVAGRRRSAARGRRDVRRGGGPSSGACAGCPG